MVHIMATAWWPPNPAKQAEIAKKAYEAAKKFPPDESLGTLLVQGFIGDKIGVNYRRSIINNRPRVKHVMTAIKKKNKKLSLHQFLALMLAFIQEIKFEIPPLQEDEKFILEFWVPPKVLVYNRGDCDSKGVTFASMWTNFKRSTLLSEVSPERITIDTHLVFRNGTSAC